MIREGRHGTIDPVEQGAGPRAVVGVVIGPLRRDDPPGVGVRGEMQHSPGPAPLGAVLLDEPLARAAEPQTGAVHQQVHRPCTGPLPAFGRGTSSVAARRLRVL